MVNINQLQNLVSKYKNTHYTKISDAEYEAADWSGIWPLVNGAGLLTGELYDGQSGECYNVMDEAMIHINDLSQTQIEKNGGYENLAKDGYVIL